MNRRLPIKLEKEPLVEAVFEIRFQSQTSAADILPGFLYSKFPEPRTLQRLPAADLPKPIREANAELRYAPLTRIEIERFSILIGDQVLTIACKLPYIGWNTGFREKIIEVLEIVNQLRMIDKVERYSTKYTNIVPAESIRDQLHKLNFSIDIADNAFSPTSLQLRLETTKNSTILLLGILTGATATLANGSQVHGVVVDVDSIVQTDNATYDEWMKDIGSKLDSLRSENKELFFDLLKEETVQEMGPQYG